MIDVMRTVAAAAAIDAPVSVNVADAQYTSISRSSDRFQIGNEFAGVFGDLSGTGKVNGSETAFTVN